MTATLKKSEYEILNLFRKNIFLSSTIRAISLTLKKPYPNTYNIITELVRKKILKIEKVGQSSVCKLNLVKESISYLSFMDNQEAFSMKIQNIDKILEFKEFFDDIILITGSYAKSIQTKQSDIDLVIIAKDKDEAFKKDKLLSNLTDLMKPEIHQIVITQKDFINMLTEKGASFGKEIFFNRILFRNSERYYELIKEAINNGFRI